MTSEELERWAIEDFEQVLGRVISVREFFGYIDYHGTCFNLIRPVKMKVVATRKTDLSHWNNEWLDPYWNLELVEGQHEVLLGMPELEKATSLYMVGDSYSLDGKYQPTAFEPRIGPREWSPRDKVKRPWK